MKKPVNKFQKAKKKNTKMNAIWWFGVSATAIIPYNVKYMKHIRKK